MRVIDPLAPVLIACTSALIISVVTAIAVAWQNRGSRNLALATGTFCGIALLFLTQVRFELQPTTTNDFILTEFGIDRAKPEIRQWVYSSGSASERPSAEVGASSWLAKQNLRAFSEDREKVTHDMVLFSLAYFLQTPEAQYWDVQRHSLAGKQTGGVIRFHASPNRQCTIVMPTELESHLARARNLFAAATVSPPYVLGMMLRIRQALTGVFAALGGYGEDHSRPVGPGDYPFPFMQIDDLTNTDWIIRPFCDQTHQMFGRDRSPSFNAEGVWIDR